VVEAEARYVTDVEECDFQHTMLLPTYGTQEGQWDLNDRFDDYTGRVPLAGKSVLDVGTATGFLMFEAEKRRATVTSFDVDSVDSIFQLPIQVSDFVRDPPKWRAERSLQLERMKNAYWLCHRDLGSSARCVYGDIYELHESIGVFDMVLVGQVLIHLRDGLSGLAAAAKACGDTIVITDGSFDNDMPFAALSRSRGQAGGCVRVVPVLPRLVPRRNEDAGVVASDDHD
jgi:hypothetical protein